MCTTVSKFQGVLKRKQVLNNIPLPLDHFFSTLCLKRHFRCLFVLTPLFKTPFYQRRVNWIIKNAWFWFLVLKTFSKHAFPSSKPGTSNANPYPLWSRRQRKTLQIQFMSKKAGKGTRLPTKFLKKWSLKISWPFHLII